MDISVYDKNVDEYEEIRIGFFKHASQQLVRLYEALFENLNFLDKQPVLEVGFGTGINLKFYPRFINLFAIEQSGEMLKKAEENIKKYNKKVTVTRGDAEKIGHEDNKFDIVIATLVLCSTKNPKKIFEEMIRVCKPNGFIGLFDYHKADEDSWIFKDQVYYNETMKKGFIYKGVPIAVYDTLYDLDKIIEGLKVNIIFDKRISNSSSESFRTTILQKKS